MPKMAARRTRVLRGGGGLTFEFSEPGRTPWLVFVSEKVGRDLLKALTDTFGGLLGAMSADGLAKDVPMQWGQGHELRFQALEDGSFSFVFVAPQGELEITATLPDAERLFADLGRAIALAKQGRHPTKQ